MLRRLVLLALSALLAASSTLAHSVPPDPAACPWCGCDCGCGD